jgi:hypothetical protein
MRGYAGQCGAMGGNAGQCGAIAMRGNARLLKVHSIGLTFNNKKKNKKNNNANLQ